MLQKKSIRLSDEAHSIIEAKADYLKISKRAAAEFMILNFAPSTKEERRYQQEAKKLFYRDFLIQHMDTDLPSDLAITLKEKDLRALVKQAWNNGYSNGWKDFQTRKFCSLGLEVPE